jgi:hypothetical protein
LGAGVSILCADVSEHSFIFTGGVNRRMAGMRFLGIYKGEGKYPNNLIPGILPVYTALKMEQCSKTSARKIQTLGNHPKESIPHSEQGESQKSVSILILFFIF